MDVLRAYTYRLRPTPAQEQQVRRYAGMGRAVYNRALAEQERRYAASEPHRSYAAQCRLLTQWRADPDMCWLADAPVHVLQQKLKDLGRAYSAFFAAVQAGCPVAPRDRQKRRRLRAAGVRLAYPPTFKKKGQSRDSLRFPDPEQITVDGGNGRVRLPKIGWLRYWNSRPVVGEVRSVTVAREGDGAHWQVSILTRGVVNDPVHPSATAVGIDRGVAQTLALSDGTVYQLPERIKRLEERIARLQQALARKERFSRNWRKAQARIARLHAQIARIRHDWLHKVTTTISNTHAVVVHEDLQTAAMTRSAGGTVEEPGTNVAAKSGLNRAILRQGWAALEGLLAYKLKWYGGTLLMVPAAYTSQQCSRCAHRAAGNRPSQAGFRCQRCGYSANADVNAAQTILYRAGQVRCAFPDARVG